MVCGRLRKCECLQDVLLRPLDGVGVEVGGGVEPEVELLLPAAVAVGVHVGVQRVGLPAHVPQELEVDLVVDIPWPLRDELHARTHTPSSSSETQVDRSSHACIAESRRSRRLTTTRSAAYVEGGDGAGGVVGDELDLRVGAREEVRVLGPEPGAGGVVERQRQHLAVGRDAPAAVAPRHLQAVVDSAGRRRRRRAGGEENQEQRQQHASPARAKSARHLLKASHTKALLCCVV